MKELSRCPVTVSLILLGILAYVLWGPVRFAGHILTFQDHLIGVARHGNLNHLALNCLLILIGGTLTELRVGSLQTAGIAVLSALLGTTVEFAFAGPGFVGLSAVAYGLVAHGMIITAPPNRRVFTIGLIGLALAIELVFLRSQIAVLAHVSAALAGGGIGMFNALFGNRGPSLKPMEWRHVAPVVEIIAQTDEDDAHEAESKFLNEGMSDMFVLQDRGVVLGVIGYCLDEQVPDLAWLSWTYLDQAHTGKGLGAQMFDDLLGKLARLGIRKIFIETSDYEEFGKKIYASAHKLYEEFGAEAELIVPDYHNRGEAKIIYGLNNPEAPEMPPQEPGTASGLVITEIHKAPETDDVAGLRWTESGTGLSGLNEQLSLARKQKYRSAVLAIPSDLSEAHEAALKAQGLCQCGALRDYYGAGIHQNWWVGALNGK